MVKGDCFYKSETKEHIYQANIKLAILWFTVKSIMEFCYVSKFHVTGNRIFISESKLNIFVQNLQLYC